MIPGKLIRICYLIMKFIRCHLLYNLQKTLTFLFFENLYCKLLPELSPPIYLVFCTPWPCFSTNPLHSTYLSDAFLPPCISFLLPRVVFCPSPHPRFSIVHPSEPTPKADYFTSPMSSPVRVCPSSATPGILPLALCFIVVVFLNLLCYFGQGVTYILPSENLT